MEDAMKIRDSFAKINGDNTIHELPSNELQILADDGNTLFEISMVDGGIEIDSGLVCKHENKILDTGLRIIPRASNVFRVKRPEYKED